MKESETDYETLDPLATRRTPVAAVPVDLESGTWFLATPRAWLRPRFNADGSVECVETIDYPPGRARLAADALKAAYLADPDSISLDLLFGLAVELMTLAHDVSRDQAARLLTMGTGRIEKLVGAVVEALRSPDLGGAGQGGEP